MEGEADELGIGVGLPFCRCVSLSVVDFLEEEFDRSGRIPRLLHSCLHTSVVISVEMLDDLPRGDSCK